MSTDNSAVAAELLAAFQAQGEVMERALSGQQKLGETPGVDSHGYLLQRVILSQLAVTKALIGFALDRENLEPEWRTALSNARAQ